ncbi:MAG: P27 family phage terminase small subunit [Planctomycetes bacterium]|nr:P27 family phage terminase small subunit [Planctomycetota bacterium]
MPGPPRQSAAELQRRGSWRAKDRARREPTPTPGRPEQPRELDGDEGAVTFWHWLCDQLDAMGVLSHADAAVMAQYCVLRANWERARRVVLVEGQTVMKRGRFGSEEVLRPEARLLLSAAPILLRYAQALGLTPVSRAKASRLDSPEARGSKARKFFAPRLTPDGSDNVG